MLGFPELPWDQTPESAANQLQKEAGGIDVDLDGIA